MAKEHPQLEESLARIRKGELSIPKGYTRPAAHHPSDSFTTVRESTYRRKKIEIHTTYRILIDGEPLQAHIAVLNDGTVHTHSLPQYSFSSAVDMVRKFIDLFSDVELPEDELGNAHAQHEER